ncbi:hypothetical protein BSMD_001770 [Bacillus subtilis Miyagi-4]|nr:hypothetical protein BSMD_001770 [Bacillus subtilis Miyagi-4]
MKVFVRLCVNKALQEDFCGFKGCFSSLQAGSMPAFNQGKH